MESSSTNIPTLPPTGAVEGDAALLAVEAEKVKEAKVDGLAPKSDTNDQTHGKAKKVPQAGLGNYFRVFAYGTALDYFLISVCSVTSIGAGIAMPLMNVVFGQLVGSFTGYFIPGTTVTRDEFQAEVNRLALLLVYLFIAKFVMSYTSMLTIRISGLRMSAALRLAYLRALFAQPVSVIDTISPGKVSTRITTSSNTIQLAISQHFAMLFQSLAFVIGLYVVAFVKGWLLTLVASTSLPFILIVYGSFIGPFIRIHKITEKHHEDASAMAFEMFSSIRIVVAFGAEARLAEQHGVLLDEAAKNESRAAPLMGLMMAPSMMSMFGTFAITFWFGIKQYSEGKIADVSGIVVVLFSVMMAVMNIGRLAGPIIAIGKAASAATELFITIDAPKTIVTGLKEPIVNADADIVFRSVGFSYPSRPDVQILEDLDLELKAGKVTAIVGPSGSGKSTIVGLVQRWYELHGTSAQHEASDESQEESNDDTAEVKKGKFKMFRTGANREKTSKGCDENTAPEKTDKPTEPEDVGPNTCIGTINIGGHDLRAVDLKWWRSQIGLVQQEPFLFNDTLFNNVIFGLCGTPYETLPKEEKMKMVEVACREAYADEFISRLPQGYETLVGESGTKLSGGQRQRIAIARSIIKQPPILILDEATSSIDVRTERIVQQALDRVSKNRTTIVIAHRLSTIRQADKIVVLRHGKVVEQGTHEELLQVDGGVYYGLVKAQELAVENDGDNEKLPLEKSTAVHTEPAEEKTHPSHKSEAVPEYNNVGLFRSFGRLLFEQRHHWALYSIGIIGVLAAGAVYPLQAYIFAKIINVFTLTGDELVTQGNFWAGMFGVLAAAIGVAYFVLGVACHLISVAVVRTYRQEYLENMIRQRIPYFDEQEHNPGSLTSQLSTDCTQLQQLMSLEMSLALIAVVNLVGSSIIAFVYGWKLSLVALFTAMPVILVAGYFRVRFETQFEKATAQVFENSSQFATEAVGAFRTVLSLIMEDTIGDRYDNLLKGHVTEAFHSAKYNTLVFAASDSIEMACMALTFWYGGTLLASREYDLLKYFVPYMAIVQGATAAGTWFSFAPNMAQATLASNRILSMRPRTATTSSCSPVSSDSTAGASIEFQNVSFTYPSRSVPVLSNLNLSIPPGHFAALVGPSGCGKSTTISLLERFYNPTHGRILFNGTDIANLDPSPYRHHLSLVSQEPTLYHGTLRQNIALSVPAAAATPSAIESACRAAQIHTFITSLPNGYDTLLGTRGLSLSGGQKQRIALARALLRRPRLLLLDEATSSLDSESEALVQGAVEAAAREQGCTVLAVAHRLATVQGAHVIFVMGEGGQVVEQGDHQALLRARGVYWSMCQAQALDR